MHTYAEHTHDPQRTVNTNVSAVTSAGPGVLPADNRPVAVTQRKLVQLANTHVSAPVVQRKPLSNELTTPEEKGIQDEIDHQNYAQAVALLEQTQFYQLIRADNIRSLQYDGTKPDFGRAEQDNNAGDVVDIFLESSSVKSIPVLVSTLHHEVLHAEQYKQQSKTGQDLKGAAHIFGQAREESPYIAAAQEIETYSSEIMHAVDLGTSTDMDFMKDRGIGLSNFYHTLYQAAKGKSKTSKQGLHLEKVKPMMRDAYDQLDIYGVDTSQYDRRGLGGQKHKGTPATSKQSSNKKQKKSP